MGFLGRCDAKLQRQHVEGLAALWFRQHPGFDSVLEAVRIHREAVQELKCTVSSNGSIGNKTYVWRLKNEPWQAVHGAGR